MAPPSGNISFRNLLNDDFEFIKIKLEEYLSKVESSNKKQIPDISITLTGTKSGIDRSLVHKRFQRTLSLLNASADPELINLEDLINYEIQNSLTEVLKDCLNASGVHVLEVPVDYSENEKVFLKELKQKTCVL